VLDIFSPDLGDDDDRLRGAPIRLPGVSVVQTTYAHSSAAGWRHGDTVDRAVERERKPLRREVLLSAPEGSRARWLTTPEGEAAAQRDVDYLVGF
jgi:hypothetical protein